MHLKTTVHVLGAKLDYQKHKKFVEVLESRNFRIFHRELNFGKVDPCCMEFSFIRVDWSNWDSVVKFDLPTL